MNKISKAAQLLGRKANGVPKKYTPEELIKRTDRLTAARVKRWGRQDEDKDIRTKGRKRSN